nr:extensin-1-like [Procambarus clarkii]
MCLHPTFYMGQTAPHSIPMCLHPTFYMGQSTHTVSPCVYTPPSTWASPPTQYHHVSTPHLLHGPVHPHSIPMCLHPTFYMGQSAHTVSPCVYTPPSTWASPPTQYPHVSTPHLLHGPVHPHSITMCLHPTFYMGQSTHTVSPCVYTPPSTWASPPTQYHHVSTPHLLHGPVRPHSIPMCLHPTFYMGQTDPHSIPMCLHPTVYMGQSTHTVSPCVYTPPSTWASPPTQYPHVSTPHLLHGPDHPHSIPMCLCPTFYMGQTTHTVSPCVYAPPSTWASPPTQYHHVSMPHLLHGPVHPHSIPMCLHPTFYMGQSTHTVSPCVYTPPSTWARPPTQYHHVSTPHLLHGPDHPHSITMCLHPTVYMGQSTHTVSPCVYTPPSTWASPPTQYPHVSTPPPSLSRYSLAEAFSNTLTGVPN